MIINLGIVSIEIINDGDSLYIYTMNGICVKRYADYNRYSRLRKDIKLLKMGEGIDL